MKKRLKKGKERKNQKLKSVKRKRKRGKKKTSQAEIENGRIKKKWKPRDQIYKNK